jgi:small GTP-binding protein
MSESQKHSFKISVVGDNQVGKSYLMEKFTKGGFSKVHDKTLGIRLSTYDREIDGITLRLVFWDIAAGNDFLFLRSSFYKKSRGAIIVFSLEVNILGKESFNHIPDWHKEILKYCGNIPIYLFANKLDLVDESRLNETKIKKIVEENNLRGYYKTSAITGNSVINAFNEITKDLYDNYKMLHSQEDFK